MLPRPRVIAAVLAAALPALWAPTASAAFVGKREARSYLLRVVPKGAPRVMLRDERAAFFRTARISIPPSRLCARRGGAVECRVLTRLVADAAHRARNWWPIVCRGSVIVKRRGDGRLQGAQGNYACRTVRA